MNQNKTVFDFKKPTWKRLINRFDLVSRTFTFIFVAIMLGSIGTMREGLRNTDIRDKRDIWIKMSVRNLENKEFTKLDEEDPPIPLKPRTGIEQFKAEFSKIV